LNGDIDVVVREQLQQILVGSQVDDGPVAIVFNHLGGTPIGGNQDPGDLFVLNGLDEVAVAQVAWGVGRIGPVEEGRADCDHDDGQEHVKPSIAPAIVHPASS